MTSLFSTLRFLIGAHKVAAVIVGVLMVGVPVAATAAVVYHDNSTKSSVNEAGHVLVVMYHGIHVLNAQGGFLGERYCQNTNQIDGRDVQFGYDVVVLSNSTANIHGQTYYLVAYPDPCQPNFDFSQNGDIASAIKEAQSGGDIPSAAVGFIAADRLSEANAAQPDSVGPDRGVWRPCWSPSCNDDHVNGRNILLPSADGNVLYAWWTGQYWDPHWWHVHRNSLAAAVYGRDWSATATNTAAQPAQSFAYAAAAVGYSPNPAAMYSGTNPMYWYSTTVTYRNVGDRSWTTSDSDSSDNIQLCPDSSGPLQIPGGCLSLGLSSGGGAPGTIVDIPVSGPYNPQLGNTGTLCLMVGHRHLLGPSACLTLVVGQTSQPTPTPISTAPGTVLTPTPSSSPSGPTPTVTPQAQTDAATFIGQSSYPTVNPGDTAPIYFVMANSGTTTWTDTGGYDLACTATCLGGQNQGLGGQQVAPGGQLQFNINLNAPSADYGQTYRTWWRMEHNGSQFGPYLYIDVTVRGWHSWYSQFRPACDDASAWQDVNHAATRDCSSSSGLVLSQYSNTSWAELDLDTPNGQRYYDQTNLRLKTQAGFLNPSDTSVWATVVVQTPQGGACGGFLLAVNSQGRWMLQQASSSCATLVAQSGQVSNFNAGGFSMEVSVLNGSLSASIDGQTLVNGLSDNLDPSPGAEGLIEESSHATSSAILFYNFELDAWS